MTFCSPLQPQTQQLRQDSGLVDLEIPAIQPNPTIQLSPTITSTNLSPNSGLTNVDIPIEIEPDLTSSQPNPSVTNQSADSGLLSLEIPLDELGVEPNPSDTNLSTGSGLVNLETPLIQLNPEITVTEPLTDTGFMDLMTPIVIPPSNPEVMELVQPDLSVTDPTSTDQSETIDLTNPINVHSSGLIDVTTPLSNSVEAASTVTPTPTFPPTEKSTPAPAPNPQTALVSSFTQPTTSTAITIPETPTPPKVLELMVPLDDIYPLSDLSGALTDLDEASQTVYQAEHFPKPGPASDSSDTLNSAFGFFKSYSWITYFILTVLFFICIFLAVTELETYGGFSLFS